MNDHDAHSGDRAGDGWSRKTNIALILVVVVIYLIGQGLIGTWHPGDKRFVFDAPSDIDFLYYGAIANTLLDTFPPSNPAFAGVKLTQPWIQYIPASILAIVVSPPMAFRILNLLYLGLFIWLGLSWFPGRAGVVIAVLFASSSAPVTINALGVDFIARGFTHVPYFLLLTVALIGRRTLWRCAAIFAAALVNGYLMLMVLPFLGLVWMLERNRTWPEIGLAALAGTATAALVIASEVVTKPFYFVFTESSSAYFAPGEMLIHAVPMALLAVFYRQRTMSVLLAVAVVFGSFIHYNPFFPVFLTYYAGAMHVAVGEPRYQAAKAVTVGLTAVMLAAFLFFAYDKYDPRNGAYYPRYDRRQQAALDWVRNNTAATDAFLALTPNGVQLALVGEFRPVYLGYVGHVSHLGLPWRERFDASRKAFLLGTPPPVITYVWYGPVERQLFPGYRSGLPVAYSDSAVTIFGPASQAAETNPQ